LNFEYFLAQRIVSSKTYKNSVSGPIIKIGIIAIAIGMVVMLIAVATGLGLQKKIREKVVAFNGHIIIHNFDTNASDESQVPIALDQDFYPEFSGIDGLKKVQAVATKFGVIRTMESFEGVVVKGVGKDYDWSYFQEFLVQGRLPDYSGKRNEEILISKYLANRMGFKIADKFQMLFGEDLKRPPRIINFEIVGIYNSGFQELDEKFCIADLRHIQRLNRWTAQQVGNFEVFVEDYAELESKTDEVYSAIPSTLNATSVAEKFFTIFEWIKIFDKNIYGIIAIMILVAGINMITALLVLILERTQMIGILKALGHSNWGIRKVFLYNAAYLIGLGLFWGNIIGLGILLVQKYFRVFPLNPDNYYVTEAPVYLSVDFIFYLNAGTFLLCLVMLIIPSIIVTKISPVKAIRFD